MTKLVSDAGIGAAGVRVRGNKGGRVLRKVLMAAASAGALLAPVATSAHTNALGFVVTPDAANPGKYKVTIYYGSWHSGAIAAEGSVKVTWNGGDVGQQLFAMVPGTASGASWVDGTRPAGLIVGDNYFYSTSAGGLSAQAQGSGTYNFQSATISNLAPGSYTFGYVPGYLSVNWEAHAPSINNGAFTITSGGDLTNVSGAVPDINAAFTTVNLAAGAVRPKFAGGTLTTNSTQALASSFTVTSLGGTINTAGNALTINGTLADSGANSGALTATGGGTLILAGNNSAFTGGFVVNGTVLRLNSTNAAGTGAIRMVNPTLEFNAAGTYANEIALEVPDPATEATVLRNTSGGLVTIDGQVHETGQNGGGAGQRVTLDQGTTRLTNNTNSWGGVTTITAGTTVQGSTSSISGGSIVNNGALQYNAVGTAASNQAISGTGTIDVSAPGTVTLNGAVTTPGTVQVSGAGSTLQLGGTRSGGAGDGGYGSGVLVSGAGAALVNAGFVQGGGNIGVRVTGQGASVTNTGSITNTGTGGTDAVGAGVAIYTAGGTTTITNGSATNNSATISGRNNAINQRGTATTALTINNFGTLQSNSYSAFENSGSAGALTVNNTGAGAVIFGNGPAGNGPRGIAANAASGLTLANSGTIVGVGGGINSAGAATITNSGTIAAGTFANGTVTRSGTGHAIDLQAGGTVTNLAGGVIAGGTEGPAGSNFAPTGIYIFGGTSTVTNAGTILGAGQGNGIISVSTAGATTVVNTGTINVTAPVAGAWGVSLGYTGSRITNAGLIGGDESVNLRNSGSFTVVNAAAGTLAGVTSAITFANTASLDFTNYGTASGTIVGASTAGSTLALQAGSGTGAITLGSGADQLVLYTGRGSGAAAVVDNVTALTLQNAGTLAAASVGTVNLGGGTNTLTLAGTGIDAATGGANGVQGTLNVATVTNATKLVKQDGGTWVLTGAAGAGNFTDTVVGGVVTVPGVQNQAGRLVALDTNAAFGNGTIRTATGATTEFRNTQSLAPGQSTPALFVNRGTFTGTGTLLFTTVAGGRTAIGNGGTANIALSQGGAVDIQGAGYFEAGTNLEGSWAANQGRLNAGAGATFRSGSATVRVDALTGAGSVVLENVAGSSFTMGVAGGDGTFDGIISGNLGFTKAGTGTQTLTKADNSYTGATIISGGTLALAGTGSITSSASVTNNANLTIAGLTNGGTTVTQLTGTGTIALGANTLTANNAAAGTISGVISGAGGFTKAGAGALTLTAANTYTGTTTVTGGTLALGDGGATGSVAGAVTLANNSLLQVNRTGTPTLANAIGGTGRVELVRSGALTGAITATGGVIVDAGVAATLSSVTGATANAVTVVGTGASVTVAAGGTVSGANSGVFTNTGTTTGITNRGLIEARGAGGSDDGVTAGGAITLDNYGTIRSTGLNAGVVTFAGGNAIANYVGATISGGSSVAGYAVNLAGAANLVQSTLSNAGTLTGGTNVAAVRSQSNALLTNSGTITGSANTTTGYGILTDGAAIGTTTNQSGGVIQGGLAGIRIEGASQTVDNAGVIRGTNASSAGISVGAGTATINNLGNAVIAGQTGGVVSTVAGTTITNAGTIGVGTTTVVGAPTFTSAGTGNGVQLAGGTITNQAGGRIIGGTANGGTTNYGVLGTGALTLTNAGAAVDGNGQVTTVRGQIVGGYTGVEVRGTAAITNAGLIGSGTLGSTGVYTRSGSDGIRMLAGGSVVNQAGGQILSSLGSGVYAEGSALATVTNTGLIASANGVFTFGSNGQALTVTNNAAGTIVGTGGYGVRNGGNGANTVTNSGRIVGTMNALDLIGAADVTNTGLIGAGTLSDGITGTYAVGGNIGIYAGNGATIRNTGGTIQGGSAAGIYVNAGLATVTNTGTIATAGTGTVDGITARGNLTLTNTGTQANGAYTGGIITAANASGVAFVAAGSITNSGRIAGGSDAAFGYGIQAAAGSSGTVTNQAGGLIEGGTGGIVVRGAGLTVDNSGTIRGNNAGGLGILFETGPANLTNRSGGIVSGISAVRATTAGTVTIDNQAGGILSAAGNGANAINRVNGAGGLLDITNAGTIRQTAADGHRAIFTNSDLRINNSGTISNAGTLSAIEGTRAVEITNTGGIDNTGAGAAINATGLLTLTNGGTVTGTSTSSGTVVAVSGLSLTNTGSITAANREAVYVGGGTMSVTNSGTLSGGSVGVWGNTTAGTSTITNLAGGTITTSVGGDGRNAIRTANATTLNNSGTISTPTAAGSFAAAVLLLGPGNTVTNNAGGTITGGRGVEMRGSTIDNYGSVTGTVDNALTLFSGGRMTNHVGATLTATGAAGAWGMFAGQNIADGSVSTSTIVNNGTINAGSGIATNFSNATITNTGSIAAQDAGVLQNGSGSIAFTNTGTVNAADGVRLVRAGSVTNTAGTIAGTRYGVTVSGGALTLVNNATLSGTTLAIRSTGAFADSVTLGATSTTSGGIDLGDGNDAINLTLGAIVTGAIAGGAGNDTLTADGSGTTTLDGTITGIETLVMNGAGTLALTGANGGFTIATINAGTVSLGGTAGTALGGAGVRMGDATLSLQSDQAIGGLAGDGVVALGANTLTVGSDGIDTTFAGEMSGTGGLTKTGTGVLTLAGANTFTGATTVASGVLRFGADDVLSDQTDLSVLNGGTLDLNGYSDTVNSFTLATGGTLTGGGTLTALAVTLNGGTLGMAVSAPSIVQAMGTTLLDGAVEGNVITTADLRVNGGTLQLGRSDQISDNAALRVTGGTLDLGAFDETVASVVTSGTINGTGTLTAATYELQGGTVNANLGAGTLTQTTNTTTLAGTSAAAIVAINGGELRLSGAERLLDTAAVTIAEGADLRLGGGVDGVETIGSLAGAGGVNLNGSTLVVGRNDTDTSFAGVIEDTSETFASGLTKVGTGTLTLTGQSYYQGPTTVAGGTLALANGRSLQPSTQMIVEPDGTLSLLANETIGSLEGAGTVTLGANTLTIGGNGIDDTLFSGSIGGTGAVNKASGERLTLSGSNGFTGGLTVSGGTLALADGGALGSGGVLADTLAVTVGDNATFDIADLDETVGSLLLNGGTVDGRGTLTAATYTLNGGTVYADLGGGALTQASGETTLYGASAAATVNVDGGTLRSAGLRLTTDGVQLTVAQDATLDLAGNVLVLNGATVTNGGTITSTGNGPSLNGGTLANTGLITASGDAVFTSFDRDTAVTNSGTIRGGFSGVISRDATNTGALTVTNTGLIHGVGYDGVTQHGTGALTVSNAGGGVIYGQNADGSANGYGIGSDGGGQLTVDNGATALIVGQYGVVGSSAADSIVNAGAITAGSYDPDTRSVSPGALYGIELRAGGSISNSGIIGGGTGAINVVGGAATIGNTGFIVNGSIDRDGNIVNPGNAITLAAGGTVANGGTILGGDSAIRVDGGALALTNTGTVGATGDAVLALGDAAQVVNAGTIRSDVLSAVAGDAALSVVNAVGGTLTGGSDAAGGYAIRFAGNGGTFVNYGTATGGAGGVVASTDPETGGNVTIALESGSTTGAINLAAGDDTVTLFTGVTGAAAVIDAATGIVLRGGGDFAAASVGAIALGGGVNTVNLRGAQTGALASGTTGVTVLNKLDTGSWTATDLAATRVNALGGGELRLDGTGTVGDIYVDGAALTLASTTAAGGATIHMIDPTTNFDATGSYANAIDFAVVDGRQAIDPNILANRSGGAITLAGALTESVAGQYVTFTGAGMTTLTGTNRWTGVTTVNAATTLVGSTGSVSGGSIVNAGALVYDQATDGTVTQVVTGAGTLTKRGAGTVTLAAANGYTGLTTVASGTLALAGGQAIADVGTVQVGADGTLALAASEQIAGLNGSGRVTLGANTLTIGTGSAGSAYVGVVSGTGGLTKVGTGIATLSGANSYTGATTVASGTLALGADNVLADATAVAVASGAILDLGIHSDTVASLALDGTLNGTGTLTAATTTLNGATVNANLGAGTLTQAGGTSTLNGTSGAATVNVTAGTLALGASNRLADAAAVTVASGSTLALGANSDTVATVALNGTLSGTGTLTAATTTLNGATVNGNLGAGTLTQQGGTSTLNGTSGAGVVNVNGGTLRLGAAERLADAATVTLASGTTLDLAGFAETVGSLQGAGTTALAAGRLTVGGTNASASYSGAITGTGDLVKAGTGTLTLVGNAGTTARLVANAGTVAFSGTTGGAIRIAGATFTGTGASGGNLALASGILSPGTAAAPVGTLQAASLTVTGGTYAADIAGSAGGFGSDLVRITGAATLAGATVAPRVLEPTANYRVSQTYTLLQAGSLSGTFANGTAFTQAGSDPALGYRLRYDLVPNAVVLELRRQIDFAGGLPSDATVNQRALAASLNGGAFTASDDWARTLNTIQSLAPAARAATLDLIGGEVATAGSTGVMLAGDRFTDMIRTRLSTGVSGATGTGLAALGNSQTMGLRRAAALGEGSSTLAGSGETRLGAWLQGHGADGTLRGASGTATVQAYAAGVAGGIELKAGAVTLGVAGSVADVETRLRARQSSAEGTLRQGGGYVAYDDGRFFTNAVASYFKGDVDTGRQVYLGNTLVGRARGDSEADGYTLGGSFGTRLGGDTGIRVAPQLSGRMVSVTRDAYTEAGVGGLNLAVGRQQRELFTAAGELRLSHRSESAGGTVEPWASAGLQRNWGDRDTFVANRFTGAPAGTGAFTLQGASLPDWAGLLGGGIEARPSDRVTLGASAQSTLSKRQKEGRLTMHLRIGF